MSSISSLSPSLDIHLRGPMEPTLHPSTCDLSFQLPRARNETPDRSRRAGPTPTGPTPNRRITAVAGSCGAQRRLYERRHEAHVPALIRHAPVGRRKRHSHGAGTLGPYQDRALASCAPGTSTKRSGSLPQRSGILSSGLASRRGTRVKCCLSSRRTFASRRIVRQ